MLASRLQYITGWSRTASWGRGLCAQMQEVMELAARGLWARALWAEGRESVKVLGMVFLGYSRNHVEPE